MLSSTRGKVKVKLITRQVFRFSVTLAAIGECLIVLKESLCYRPSLVCLHSV